MCRAARASPAGAGRTRGSPPAPFRPTDNPMDRPLSRMRRPARAGFRAQDGAHRMGARPASGDARIRPSPGVKGIANPFSAREGRAPARGPGPPGPARQAPRSKRGQPATLCADGPRHPGMPRGPVRTRTPRPRHGDRHSDRHGDIRARRPPCHNRRVAPMTAPPAHIGQSPLRTRWIRAARPPATARLFRPFTSHAIYKSLPPPSPDRPLQRQAPYHQARSQYAPRKLL